MSDATRFRPARRREPTNGSGTASSSRRRQARAPHSPCAQRQTGFWRRLLGLAPCQSMDRGLCKPSTQPNWVHSSLVGASRVPGGACGAPGSQKCTRKGAARTFWGAVAGVPGASTRFSGCPPPASPRRNRLWRRPGPAQPGAGPCRPSQAPARPAPALARPRPPPALARHRPPPALARHRPPPARPYSSAGAGRSGSMP